jgi:outer membrane protein, heavy metal efflux system
VYRITVIAAALLLAPLSAHTQETAPASLGELIAEARRASPDIAAARMGVEAATARVPQAGALPDPMLSLGIQNVPVPELDLGMEGMTMGMVQLGQRFPAAGVRSARTTQAEALRLAAEQRLAATTLSVEARVKRAYYSVWFADRSLGVLDRNRALLEDLAHVASTRYAVGRVPQADVLRAQTEITRLDEQRAGVEATRSGALAELNEVLRRPAGTVVAAELPPGVQALASARPEAGLFAAAALDRDAVPGIPPLAALLERAVARPAVAVARAEEEAAAAAAEVSRREVLPDVEVMLGYAARRDRPSLATAMVSVPLPLWAGRKQRPRVLEAEAVEARAGAQVDAELEAARAAITARHAELARSREQVTLLADGVIPQAEATLESSLAAYQAGRLEFISLLEAQAALYRYEIELARRLADLGQALAALEEAVGAELIDLMNDPQEG